MSGGAGAPFSGDATRAPEGGAGAPFTGDATPKARRGTRINLGAHSPLPGRTYAHGRRHCSAVRGPGRGAADTIPLELQLRVRGGGMSDSVSEAAA